jgi:hypothetical protein
MGMRSKLIPAIIFLLVTVLAVPLMMRLGKGRAPEPVTITELDAGPGRVIRVTVEPNSQQTLSLHYHVEVDGQPQVEHAFFGTLPRTSPPPVLLIHREEGGDLVGLTQASVPNRIIILHDFATGESWPLRKVTYKDIDPNHIYPYYEEEEPIMARGEDLFTRLSQALPDQPLELLRTMGTRPLTVPGGSGIPAPSEQIEDPPGD